MEPKPGLYLQPDAKRRRPLDSVEDAVEPGDVDEEEDQAWKDWISDESGTKRAPLPPVNQPEMGIHAPTPEMDEEDERRQEEDNARRKKWNEENDPDSVPRGVWEMKQ